MQCHVHVAQAKCESLSAIIVMFMLHRQRVRVLAWMFQDIVEGCRLGIQVEWDANTATMTQQYLTMWQVVPLLIG